jgi:hypothetical protein
LSQIAIDLADSSAAFASLEIVETKASVATNPCSSIFFQRAVGVLWPDSVPPRIEELREGLRDLGYVEAENIIIEYRCADGMRDRAARMQILSRCTKTLVVQD